MINEKSTVLDIEVAGESYEIRQSLGLLTSSNTEGTTGAALWKITPIVANWLGDQNSVLWSNGILHSRAIVIELGCGISGLIGYALASRIAKCVLTDQRSILKLLDANVASNLDSTDSLKQKKRSAKGHRTNYNGTPKPKIYTRELNWELDDESALTDVLEPNDEIDLIVLCDCVYNDFLAEPLIRTCENLCGRHGKADTVLLIAQQLRSDEVVSLFLSALSKSFDIWRLFDAYNHPELRDGSGFAIHLACLKKST